MPPKPHSPYLSANAGVRWYRHGGQRLLAALEISFASVLASWLVIDAIGPPVRWPLLLLGVALTAGSAALATFPRRAGIAVTPPHLIVRTGNRETTLVPWAEVAGFEIGQGLKTSDQKGMVYVRTADGTRLHTLGYCARGASPREAWELLRALEDERLARVPGATSTLPLEPPPERRRSRGSGGVWGVIGLVILSALPLYFVVTGLGPSIRAARGEGTIGYFIPQQETTGRGETWYGEFRLPDGTVTVRSASIEDVPVSAMQTGVPVPARDPGNSEATFPPGTQAVFPRVDPGAWHLVAGLAVLVGWCYGWALVLVAQRIRARRRSASLGSDRFRYLPGAGQP